MSGKEYPQIGDYGFISDCHSCALVSRDGSIDWCCMPRIDSMSSFARILDWEKGGYCQIVPSGNYESSRRYIEDTLVLETTFRTDGGTAVLYDCFPMHEGGEHSPYRQILRIVEGRSGSVDFRVEVIPRFDFGEVRPWIQRCDNYYIALGGSDGFLISNDFGLRMAHRHDLEGAFAVKEGQRARLSILFRRPEDIDERKYEIDDAQTLDERLNNTIKWWKNWTSQGHTDVPYAKEARRSAIVLKGLCNAPTGAIAAAATTSLPESPGGSRNYDYRFSWVRDSAFTVRALATLGYVKEADGFRRFIERSAAGSAEEIQIVFGVGGERRLSEQELRNVQGYRQSAPVRVGNAAVSQLQLDVYGELLALSWNWYKRGHTPDEDYWEFIVELVNAAAELWSRPDHGIWEMRSERRHFVQSKAMCWSAVNNGINMAEQLGREVPLDKWKKARDDIMSAVEEKGYDRDRGIFVQAFDKPILDAALLLMPGAGFVDYNDDRMVRTTDAVWKELGQAGFLRRYPEGSDALEGGEGAFLACSFWLVECLAHQKRLEEAREVFERTLTAGNDLGLFSEEYSPDGKELLGNFPQGLTHLSLITAAFAIGEAEK